jgi:hypothetical protein
MNDAFALTGRGALASALIRLGDRIRLAVAARPELHGHARRLKNRFHRYRSERA